MIILAPLGIFSRASLGDNIAFYLNDIIIALIILIWFLFVTIVRKKILLPKEFIPLALFLIVALIGLINAKRFLGLKEVLISSLYLVRLFEYSLLGLVVADVFRQVRKDTLKKLLVTSALVLSLLGFVQYVIIPDFTEISLEGGWDPHQYRLLSTFFDPNFSGLFIGLALLLVLIEFLSSRKNAFISLTILTTLMVALVLTYSRSSYLAFIVGVLILGVVRWRFLLPTLLGLSIAVSLLFPRIWLRFEEGVSTGTSGEARITTWLNAFEIVKDHPLVGVGFNTYRYVQTQYGFLPEDSKVHSAAGTDSSLLLILTTTGVVGLALFTFFLYMVFKTSLELIHKEVGEGYVLLSSLIALLVHSQFVNSLVFPWILMWMMVIIGLSLAKKYETS